MTRGAALLSLLSFTPLGELPVMTHHPENMKNLSSKTIPDPARST